MAPDNYNQVEYLLEMIREAFRGVTLGDGVSIRQTEVIDAYGSDEEQAAARAKDKTTDWPSLVDDPVFHEVQGVGGTCFLDDEGYHFYLPVYLTMLIKDDRTCPEECEYVLWHLASPRAGLKKDPFPYLTGHQRRCIRHCLKYRLHNKMIFFDREAQKMKRAIEEYWTPQS